MSKKQDRGAAADDVVKENPPLQGEGNYTASRNYVEKTEDFVESGKVDDAARKAAPKSPQEAAEMERAEREGLRHARK